METTQLDWEELARSRLFSSPRVMIVGLYYINNLSLLATAQYIGVSVIELAMKMKDLKLPLKHFEGDYHAYHKENIAKVEKGRSAGIELGQAEHD